MRGTKERQVRVNRATKINDGVVMIVDGPRWEVFDTGVLVRSGRAKSRDAARDAVSKLYDLIMKRRRTKRKESSMPNFDPVEVVIRGPHDSGKTTLANLIKMWLEENGYRDIEVCDLEPLSQDQKPAFMDRFTRNRDLRPVVIRAELKES